MVVVGTGTEVGKTWVAARLLAGLRAAGVTVAARKPAQSFDAGEDPGTTDAAVLGRASGEAPEAVCPPHRWYPVAMAPPMAAEVLGRPSFAVAELLDELGWGGGAGFADRSAAAGEGPRVGVVETAGGVRSPLAGDGDAVDLVAALAPDMVLLVADAGLGTLNAVRLTAGALSTAGVGRGGGPALVVVLNRFDTSDDLHRRNRQWLSARDRFEVVVMPGDLGELAGQVLGSRASR